MAILAQGCTTASEAEMRSRESVYRDPVKPDRIQFVVYGDPGMSKYPEINSMPLPMHEKIREGMRRHAAHVLAERGWCPNGFVGPELWGYERERLLRRFYVDCKN